MARNGDDAGARFPVALIGIILGVYGLGLAIWGQDLLDYRFVERWALLLVAGGFSLAGGVLALFSLAPASQLLIVSAAVWLGFAVVFAGGQTIWTYAPLLLTIIAIALAFRAAGAAEVMRAADRLNIGIGKVFAYTVVILTAVVCYEVFMRYVLRMPTRWGYDAGYMLYGIGFMVAGGYALAQNAHVRADVIYRFWPPRVQASVDLVLFLLFFFPAAFFFIYQGYLFAERSWLMREFSSASPFNIPVYHFKTFIPISGMLLFLQGISEIIRAGLCLRDGYWLPRLSDVEEIEKLAMEGHLDASIAGIPVDETLRADGNGPGPSEGRS